MARSKEFDEFVVLDKAMKLFWEQGYEKTSLSDLVEHMGIHRRSLYDTFGDKHSLFIRALDRFHHRIKNELTSKVGQSTSAIQSLEIIFDYAINGEKENPKGCMMVNSAVELALRDGEINKKVIENFEATELFMKDIISFGQRNNEFQLKIGVDEMAEYLHTVWIGLRVMTRTSTSKEKLNNIVKITLEQL